MGDKLGTADGHRDAGFTLIELLVVVAIMSVLAVGVSITAIRSGNSAGTSDMAWFQNQFERHQALAIVSGQSYGLFVHPNELRIAQNQSDGWAAQGSARRWRGRVTLVNKNTKRDFGDPDVVVLASGQSSAFSITFGSSQTRTCRSDGWTGLTCDAN